jgi:hypothetical protein
MTFTRKHLARRERGAGPSDRLRNLLALHLHPEHGSRYWLRRQDQLGFDVRDRVRTLDDLYLLGPTPLPDLRRFPLRDFIPQSFHRQLHRFVVGETAGTSGQPLRHRLPRRRIPGRLRHPVP